MQSSGDAFAIPLVALLSFVLFVLVLGAAAAAVGRVVRLLRGSRDRLVPPPSWHAMRSPFVDQWTPPFSRCAAAVLLALATVGGLAVLLS